MPKRKRVENQVLAKAGLDAMARAGKPLTPLKSKGRARIYCMSNDETVRVRTCNDPVLIVRADRDAPDAKLNIEGTDWLLFVMLEGGNAVSYLLPTEEVVGEARRTHWEWRDTNPNTKGDNKTWNLWFDKDAPTKANGYGTKWAKYSLDISSMASHAVVTNNGGRQPNLMTEVEDARQRLAQAAGVPIEAIRIDFRFPPPHAPR